MERRGNALVHWWSAAALSGAFTVGAVVAALMVQGGWVVVSLIVAGLFAVVTVLSVTMATLAYLERGPFAPEAVKMAVPAAFVFYDSDDDWP